jgi:pantothenate kinase
MDGYHIAKSQLWQMGQLGKCIGDPDGTTGATTSYDGLLKRRGAPWTFDPKQLYLDLLKAKQNGNNPPPPPPLRSLPSTATSSTGSDNSTAEDEQQQQQQLHEDDDNFALFAQYDRQISDPLPDQIAVSSHNTQIVLCEGNYLIAYDDPVWYPLHVIWDDTWLIHVMIGELKDRIAHRHMATWDQEKDRLFGRGIGGAARKAETSDLKHAQWVYDQSIKYANVIVNNG